MKLVAAVMVGNGERDRYLSVTVPALLEFCDAVVAVDESTDGSGDLAAELGALVERTEPGSFFAHEGRARNLLLDVAFEQNPSHVLVIDADELVADGEQLRAACASQCPVLVLQMEEIWRVHGHGLEVRIDGGWRPHPTTICFQVPEQRDGSWRIQDRALACGREPVAVRDLHRRSCSEWSGTEVLHLGWANRAERQARYDRYVVNDGGRFHANAHLQSIMWDDARVRTQHRPWPRAWPEPLRARLLERASRA